jgi:ariadne-1
MDDPTKVQQLAGITCRCFPVNKTKENDGIMTRDKGSSLKKEVDCLICMDTVSFNDSLKMPCGHAFCRDCWGDYLNNVITSEGGTCLVATCPDATCTEKITEVEIQVAAPGLLDKYQKYRLDSFAEAIGRWCPGPGCDRICITNGLENDNPMVAECESCDTQFCTSCSSEPHAPASCEQLTKWTAKNTDESETVNYIKINTKVCPKCSSRIEKNGGCQFMTCRKCGHGFCWVCGGTHHVWDCNSYKEKPDEADERVRATNALERFMHYQTRYQGHHEGQEFARKQLVSNKEKQKQDEEKDEKDMAEASSSKSWKSIIFQKNPQLQYLPEFLTEANEQVVVCRRVLKYTYVFAFYHFEDPKRRSAKEVFENHQGQLERLTEGLSEVIEEEDVDKIDRSDVVNRTRVIGNFIRNVLESVEKMLVDEDIN